MSNHARHSHFGMVVLPFVAGFFLALENDAQAQSDGELPSPAEPWFAEEGDWAADFNDAQKACYQGSMTACDLIWLSERVLLDSFLSDYGRSCGGRVDRREISRANLTCAEAFPGHD